MVALLDTRPPAGVRGGTCILGCAGGGGFASVRNLRPPLGVSRPDWSMCGRINSRTQPSSTWSRDTGGANTLVADRAKNWLQTVFVSLQVENRSRASLSDMLTPAADVTSRAMRSSTNCDYFRPSNYSQARRQGVLSRCPRAWNRLPS